MWFFVTSTLESVHSVVFHYCMLFNFDTPFWYDFHSALTVSCRDMLGHLHVCSVYSILLWFLCESSVTYLLVIFYFVFLCESSVVSSYCETSVTYLQLHSCLCLLLFQKVCLWVHIRFMTQIVHPAIGLGYSSSKSMFCCVRLFCYVIVTMFYHALMVSVAVT